MSKLSIVNARMVASGGEATTVGTEIARLLFFLRQWTLKSLELEGSNDTQTKNNINNWLDNFQDSFHRNMVAIDTKAAFTGFSAGRVSASALGTGVVFDNILDRDVFLDIYRERVAVFSSQELTKSVLLRNSVANKFTNGKYREFFKQVDEGLKEGKALGLTTREQNQLFLQSSTARNFVSFDIPGSDGIVRRWMPETYGAMYSRTRSREMEDNAHVESLVQSNIDIVQVSPIATVTPICSQFVGKFFSLTGQTPGLPKLEIRAPFHPNCVHRIIAARTDDIAKLQRANNIQGRRADSVASTFTDGQKASIQKQEAWNLANRPQIVA